MDVLQSLGYDLGHNPKACCLAMADNRILDHSSTLMANGVTPDELLYVWTPHQRIVSVLGKEIDSSCCALKLADYVTRAEQLRVLLLRVSPTSRPITSDLEENTIQRILGPGAFSKNGRVIVDALGAVRKVDFQRKMNAFKPHVVHFMGHGFVDGVHLEDGDYLAEDLAVLFKARPECCLAIFNCCNSAWTAYQVCELGNVPLSIGTCRQVCSAVGLPFLFSTDIRFRRA